jgi:hypothetical protein
VFKEAARKEKQRLATAKCRANNPTRAKALERKRYLKDKAAKLARQKERYHAAKNGGAGGAGAASVASAAGVASAASAASAASGVSGASGAAALVCVGECEILRFGRCYELALTNEHDVFLSIVQALVIDKPPEGEAPADLADEAEWEAMNT